MTPISPELRAFLADWLAWVERGAPEGKPYWRRYGLCTGLRENAPYSLAREMGDHLARDLGNRYFPFGNDEYLAAKSEATQHLDPNRLAWVRAKLAEGGEL